MLLLRYVPHCQLPLIDYPAARQPRLEALRQPSVNIGIQYVGKYVEAALHAAFCTPAHTLAPHGQAAARMTLWPGVCAPGPAGLLNGPTNGGVLHGRPAAPLFGSSSIRVRQPLALLHLFIPSTSQQWGAFQEGSLERLLLFLGARRGQQRPSCKCLLAVYRQDKSGVTVRVSALTRTPNYG